MGCDCKGGNGKAKDLPIDMSGEYTPVKPSRLSIYCNCGLQRLIPTGLEEGDSFELVPCPKCGGGFRGIFMGEQVEKVG